MIAKENINCSRYKEFPKNVNVQDVENCRRAVSNNSTTHKNLRGIKDRLSNSNKKELYSPDFKLRPWASNELTFVEEELSVVETMIKEMQSILNDIAYFLHQLQKRFGEAHVLQSERQESSNSDSGDEMT